MVYNVMGRIFMLQVYLLYFTLEAYSCRNSSFPRYRVWQIVVCVRVGEAIKNAAIFFIFCQANRPCPTRPAFLCKTIVRHLDQQRKQPVEWSGVICWAALGIAFLFWTCGQLDRLERKCVHVWTWPKIFSSNTHHLCLFKADICVVIYCVWLCRCRL